VLRSLFPGRDEVTSNCHPDSVQRQIAGWSRPPVADWLPTPQPLSALTSEAPDIWALGRLWGTETLRHAVGVVASAGLAAVAPAEAPPVKSAPATASVAEMTMPRRKAGTRWCHDDAAMAITRFPAGSQLVTAE
jgi:hypothetical protein